MKSGVLFGIVALSLIMSISFVSAGILCEWFGVGCEGGGELKGELLQASGSGTNGLIAHWEFEDNYEDSVGGNDGSKSGNVNFGTGKVGKGIVLDGGPNSYVDVGDLLAIGSEDFSMSVWVKWTGGNDNLFIRPIVNFGSTDIGKGFMLSTGLKEDGEDKLAFSFDEDGSGPNNAKFYNNAGSGLNDGNWHHVVAVKESDNIIIYIDGASKGYVQTGSKVGVENRIGKGLQSYVYGRFKGSVDDLKIWNRPLNSEEVLDEYGESSENLVTHFEFEGNLKDSFGGTDGSSVGNIGYTGGRKGKALDLDGNEYVRFSSGDLSDMDSISVAAWVKLEPTLVEKVGHIVSRYGPKGIQYSLMYSKEKDLVFFINGDKIGNAISSTGGNLKFGWHHVTGVFDGQSKDQKIFIDGKLANIRKFKANLNNPDVDILIGNTEFNYLTQYFKGDIDEVKIWDNALKDGDVLRIYKELAFVCANECITGEKTCFGDGYRDCGNFDEDFCIEWSEVNDCQSGQICSNGICENVAISSELNSHYKFEGNLEDSVGGRYGSSIGNLQFTDGMIGKSLYLDGNDFVRISSNDLPDIDSISVSGWINIENTYVDKVGHIVTRYGPNGIQFSLMYSKNRDLVFYINGDGLGNALTSEGIKLENGWHHVAGVFDGETKVQKVYIDGQLRATKTFNVDLNNPDVDILIGNSQFNYATQFFKGNIDEVRIIGRALSDTEVFNEFSTVTDLSDNSRCVDTDGGRDYFTKGTTIPRSGAEEFTDTCNGDILIEGTCDEQGGKTYEFTCQDGCIDGECKKPVLTNCEDKIGYSCKELANCASSNVFDSFICNNNEEICCKEDEEKPSQENKGYKYANWKCYDGEMQKFSEETSCNLLETWKKYAEDYCDGRCIDSSSECGINSFGISIECYYDNDEIIQENPAINDDEVGQDSVDPEVIDGIEICKNSCASDGKCYPIGFRNTGEFCSDKGEFVTQIESDGSCMNNFECSSNLCIDGSCISENLLNKILEWLKNLLGIE